MRKGGALAAWKQKIITGVVIVGMLGIATSAGAVFWLSRDLPDPHNISDRTLAESTRIYDRTGQHILFEVHGTVKRTKINLEDLPDRMVWATLVAEDRDFYRHGGIKFTSIIRAILVNLSQGGKAQGASTITQQFLKNAVLTTEKRYSRKIKEILLAWQLERTLTKDEILELYFNEIPYGSVAYGVASAADIYFDKKVSEITLAEAAVLSALPKAPSYYSPYGNNKDALIARQQFILNAMVDEGYITQEEADAAKAEEIAFEPPKGNITAPHFVMYVREHLAETYGEKEIEQGGLKVITSLDLFKQELAEEAIEHWGEINERDHKAQNASLVSIDPKTGEVLAMVGSRNFFDTERDGQVNVALRPRQPGSSFKPIVYAASFEQGLSPDTILFDTQTVFKTDTDDYEPNNYDGQTLGPVTIRKALAGSLNIPAVKTIYLTGMDNVLNLADNLGYTTLGDRSRFGLSLVLGGGEVKLLEHVAAYGAFARDGELQPTVAILKVEDKDGKTLEETKFKRGEKILDTHIVRQLNSILSDNSAREYVFGAQSYLTLGGRPVAAKTGSTNDNRDAWTVGFTPSLATGVWVGNNDFTPMGEKAVGASVAAPIWNQYMRAALGDTPVEQFKAPVSVPLPDKPMLNGETGDVEIVRIDRATRKRATALTPPSFVEEKKFQTLHNILHFVTPGNLLGPTPANPSRDPNYQTWEDGVLSWAEENEIETSEVPPEEFDTIHTLENRPSLSITSPPNNFTLTDPLLQITVNTSAPRGVKQVTYSIGGKFIGTETSPSYNLTHVIKNLPNGRHTLRAEVFDDVDNSYAEEISFNLALPDELVPFTVNLDTPQPNTFYTEGSFPLETTLNINKPERVKKIDYYVKSNGGATSQWLGFTESIAQGGTTSFVWTTTPDPGGYTFYAVATDITGTIVRSDEIPITIE